MATIAPVLNGTFTCPDHPDVGPIALGYTGDEPPAMVTITHDDNGNHVATPAVAEAPADDEGSSTDPPASDGGEGDGEGAETQKADGSPESPQDGDGGGDEGAE